VERFRRDSGISARFLADGGRVALPPARAIELVRITQEALVNVRKHSRARNVLVRLSAGEGTCSLVVEDDGCGFEFDGHLTARELDERHVGPAMIKERARLAGAELSVHSTPGAGARVEVAFGEPVHA
jgi:signal transduction histidine kinase